MIRKDCLVTYSGTENRYTGNKAGLLILFPILFLALSYSPYHYWDESFYLYTLNYHSLTETISKENDLSAGLFPRGFFSSKIGSMIIISLLIKITGDGWLGLYSLQFIFALFMIGFFLVAYKLYSELIALDKEVNFRWPLTSATIALFLPVSMYLGFKVLTEVPALFFTTFGSWMFLKSIRETKPHKVGLLLSLAFAGIVIGAACRYLFLLSFGGLVLSCGIIFWQRDLIGCCHPLS